jgi:hypothetical protein
MDNRDKDRLDLESPLGLADEPIKKTDADHLDRPTDPSSRRRRARALGEDGIERRSSGMDDVDPDANGASGIDMGYGGEGTDVKPSR